MLPIKTTVTDSRFFQFWEPASFTGYNQDQMAEYPPDYIELPTFNNYQELESHHSFPTVKAQFLSDIQELKLLARHYVNQQYDNAIEVFYNRLEKTPEYLQFSILPLYRETRFQIHRLVTQLKNQQSHQSTDGNADCQAYIASVLHDCLDGIDLCPAGVHSRFTHAFLNVEASRAGLEGKLFRVKTDLYHQFIKSFLFQLQREGQVCITEAMEIHWFNALYNLYCNDLTLSSIEDPFATTHLNARLVLRFQSAASLCINNFTILRNITNEWSSQLSATLEQLGVSAWQTDPILPSALTVERTGFLDNKVFKPINHLLKATGDQSLHLGKIIEEKDNGYFHLDRYREKLLAWASLHFFESTAKVFAPVSVKTGSKLYIGTVNECFFWVFNHDQGCHTGQAYTFATDNHITLQLSHLTSLDFISWPQTTVCALLSQAIAQTSEVEDITAFFLCPAISEQLGKMPELVIQALANLLTEKMVQTNSPFKKKLYRQVRIHLANSDARPLLRGIQLWLMPTPLLEPVLLALQENNISLTPFVIRLDCCHISAFSQESIKKLLRPVDCLRLFKQAFYRKQGEAMLHLLSTGHWTDLLKDNPRQERPLDLFAELGYLPGLQYVLRNCNARDVNEYNKRTGLSALHRAARSGNEDCVQALLALPFIRFTKEDDLTPLHLASSHGHTGCVRALVDAGIRVNREAGAFHETALQMAAKLGHAACVRVLLAALHIDPHPRCPGSYTALHLAAIYGHAECVMALVNTGINEKTYDAETALHLAADNGHEACVRVLLLASDIKTNGKNRNYRRTALHLAAFNGHTECVRMLADDHRVRLNAKDNSKATALHLAASTGRTGCIRVLLGKSGILVEEKNHHGDTPLSLAKRFGHTDCIRVLQAAKPDGQPVKKRARYY